MNDKTKIIGALVLGAIAGAIIVKLLETEEGKEIVEKAKDKVKSTAHGIKEKINQLQEELVDLLNNGKENNQA